MVYALRFPFIHGTWFNRKQGEHHFILLLHSLLLYTKARSFIFRIGIGLLAHPSCTPFTCTIREGEFGCGKISFSSTPVDTHGPGFCVGFSIPFVSTQKYNKGGRVWACNK